MITTRTATVDVIIPALNEEKPLPFVLADIDPSLVRRIIVADNGSTDQTAKVAEESGAVVVPAPKRGYGSACLAAMLFIAGDIALPPPDIIVFLDADHADDPSCLNLLISPIAEDRADLVIGARAKKLRQPGSMTPAQIFGNRLATALIALFWGFRFTDLGPFRAIRYQSLLKLNMVDTNYGWTVEMQIKAVKQGLRCLEIEVPYRQRQGLSKISGTVKGTFMAGYKILWTIFKYGVLKK